MAIKRFVFNKIEENSYLVWNDSNEALIIDPGCQSAAELESVCKEIDSLGLKPLAILVTHPHFDHISGIAPLWKKYRIKAIVNSEDRSLLMSSKELAKVYNASIEGALESISFIDGSKESLQIGGFDIRLIHIAGHTKGSIAYYIPSQKALFSGDTLRKGTLGFLETGYKDLFKCIREQIIPLPEDTAIYFGHGEESTVGAEKLENKFFKRSLADG